MRSVTEQGYVAENRWTVRVYLKRQMTHSYVHTTSKKSNLQPLKTSRS